MNKTSLKKFLEHPDKDELISKLIEGVKPKELHDWLQGKYISEAEKRFILSEDLLSEFKDKHLDYYVIFRNDVLATKGQSTAIDKAVSTSLNRNKKYREKLMEYAGKETNIKDTIRQLVNKIEMRVDQVFEQIQENNDPDDFKDDHTLIKWMTLLMEATEKVNKIVNEAPDQVVQHQHTIQIADQQITIIIDTIKDILSKIDYEASLYFLEQYHERLGNLTAPEEFKPTSADVRLAEAKMLSDRVDTKTQDDLEGPNKTQT